MPTRGPRGTRQPQCVKLVWQPQMMMILNTCSAVWSRTRRNSLPKRSSRSRTQTLSLLAHVSKSAEGMANTRVASAGVSVVVGDGKAHSPSKIGDVSVTQYLRSGKAGKKLLWKDVHISEQFEYNLLSVTKYMKEGWKLTGSATEMTLSKGEVLLTFDILIKTGQGTLYCAYFKRNTVDTAAVAAGKPKDTAAKSSLKKNSIAIRAAHCKYEHLGEAECRNTTNALGCRVL